MQTAVQIEEQKAGLLYWAHRVLEECDKASLAFAPDPVHDLRVAIRRCRSMADGFISIDPDRRWKRMKGLVKPLFAALGELRDTQIMLDWATRLAPSGDHVGAMLQNMLGKREEQQRLDAQDALRAFDRQHWMELNRELAGQTALVPLEGTVFQFLALERLNDARLLHRRAMRNRSSIAYHQLRIGIKRFRYTVENFLPQRHKQWSKDLRFLQDALGEVHDCDVLWATIRLNSEVPAAERMRWREMLSAQREQRIQAYRNKMLGRQSLWHLWESELPRGEEKLAASLEKLRTWAEFLRTPSELAKRTTALALLIYDELAPAGVISASHATRSALLASCTLCDIGVRDGDGGDHKRAFRMVRRIPPPLGWTPEMMHGVAAIVRYQGDKLPSINDAALTGMSESALPGLFKLAGILRLARALGAYAPGGAEISARCAKDVLTITVGPMAAAISRAGERLSQSRYLLEASCKISVVFETAPAQPDGQ